jgi:hypothetical protein
MKAETFIDMLTYLKRAHIVRQINHSKPQHSVALTAILMLFC